MLLSRLRIRSSSSFRTAAFALAARHRYSTAKMSLIAACNRNSDDRLRARPLDLFLTESGGLVVTRTSLPPGPKGTLIGGNIGQVGPRRVDFFLELARTYGPLASFRVGRWRLFLASDPNLIQQVLVTDAKHYIKHFGARIFKPVLGNGLVTSEGDFWLRQRRLLKQSMDQFKPCLLYTSDAADE